MSPDTICVTVEKVDEISVQDIEDDHNSTKNEDILNDQDGITNCPVNDNSTKKRVPNVSSFVLLEQQENKSSRIILNEQSLHCCGAQRAESMEISPLDDMTMDTEEVAAEAKPGKDHSW